MKCLVVLVDAQLSRIAVISTPMGWMLPHVEAPSAVRTSVAVSRSLAASRMTGRLLFEKWLPANDALPGEHRYCLIQADSASSSCVLSGLISWRSPRELDRCRSAVQLHETVLKLALDVYHRDESEDSHSIVDDVSAWVDTQLPAAGVTRIGQAEVIDARTTHFCYRYRTTIGAVFVKGGRDSVRSEAHVTQRLASLFPQHFSRTLAFDDCRRWWMSLSVPGTSLASSTRHSQADRVMAAIGTIQALLAESPEWQKEASELTGAQMAEAAVTLGEVVNQRAISGDDLGHLGAEIDSSVLPRTWVHPDLMPANVFLDLEGVYFIDLDSIVNAMPLLPLWRLISTLQRDPMIDSEMLERMRNCYVAAWNASGLAGEVERLWPRLKPVGLLLRLWACDRWCRALEADDGYIVTRDQQRQLVMRTFEALARSL